MVEHSNPIAPRFDRGRHWRAKLGFVLLAMEQTVADDMIRYAPEGVGVHFTRAAMANAVTVENLAAMIDDLPRAASTLLPEGGLDVICYACTSGTVVMGEQAVTDALRQGSPTASPTTLLTGVIEALRALSCRKISVATPYLEEINVLERDYLQSVGFEVDSIQGMQIERDEDMVRVSPDSIRNFAMASMRNESDALFVSCGALRSVDVIESMEAELGKPVITSNQAMLWHCLRLAGVNDQIEGLGRLLEVH